MKYIFFFACLLFCFSCSNNDKPRNEERIRVTGEGKIRVKPNLVTLTISVAFTQPRMVDAVRKTQQTVDSVVAILGQYGTIENDLKTSSVSANKEYSYNGRTEVFVGYKAEQSMDFVLKDINQFTELTGKLLHTRIYSLSKVQFGHAQQDSLYREADLLAYDDALKSARKLCSRANVTLGKLLYLTNTPSGSGTDRIGQVVREEMNTYAKGYGGSGLNIAPEVLEFKRKVISEYAISN